MRHGVRVKLGVTGARRDSVCASHRSRSRVLTSPSSQSESSQLLLHSHLITEREIRHWEDVGGITSTIDLSDQTLEQDCQDILSKIFLQATNFKTLKAAKICSLLWFCALLRVRGKIITPRVGMLDINNNSCICMSKSKCLDHFGPIYCAKVWCGSVRAMMLTLISMLISNIHISLAPCRSLSLT